MKDSEILFEKEDNELREWEKKSINEYEQQLVFMEQQIDWDEGLWMI